MATKKNNPWTKHLRRLSHNIKRRNCVPNGALVLNSLPKSGTYLAHQILDGLDFKDFDGFFASTPSWSMHQKSPARAASALSKIYDGELFTGHIFYSPIVEEKLTSLNLPNIFLYRDPRAIFVSEWHYLVNINKYHRYHRALKNLDPREQFDLLLYGDDKSSFYFPSFANRLLAYEGWMSSTSTFKLRFEDLMDMDGNPKWLDSLAEYLAAFDKTEHKEAYYRSKIRDLRFKLNSENSHTYTGLDPHRWSWSLAPGQKKALDDMTQRARDVLGYF